MRALIQKPSRASVTVDDRAVGKIGAGLVIFGAGMEVALVNDGPVTIWLDSAHALTP